MSIDVTASYWAGDEKDWDSIPRVNMANGNAATVLRALGFTDFGVIASEGVTVTPLDMRSRASLALGLFDHIEERPGVREHNYIDCGTDRAYVASKIQEILEVVDWCDRQGRSVSIY